MYRNLPKFKQDSFLGGRGEVQIASLALSAIWFSSASLPLLHFNELKNFMRVVWDEFLPPKKKDKAGIFGT